MVLTIRQAVTVCQVSPRPSLGILTKTQSPGEYLKWKGRLISSRVTLSQCKKLWCPLLRSGTLSTVHHPFLYFILAQQGLPDQSARIQNYRVTLICHGSPGGHGHALSDDRFPPASHCRCTSVDLLHDKHGQRHKDPLPEGGCVEHQQYNVSPIHQVTKVKHLGMKVLTLLR